MANRFVMEQVRREQERKAPVKSSTGNPDQAQTRTVRPVESTTASAAKSIREELAAARRANPPSRTYLPWEVSSTSAGEDHTEKYTGTLKTLTERLEAGERELTGLKQRYTSAPSEEVRTAYNSRLNSYNRDLDTYRTVQKNYDAYQSPQGIQGRVDQLKSRAGDLERDRRERSIALQSSAAELETAHGEEAMRRAMEKLRSSYKAYGAVQKDIESVKKRTADLETEGVRRSFEPLRQAADFAEKSVYRSTERGEPKFNALTGTYSDTGFGDITYDYINANERARSRQLVNDMGSQAALLGMDQSFLKELEPDEIALFNYVYAQKGKDSAYQYLKSISGDLTYRQRKKSEAEWAEYAREHPVGTSVFSVLESPMKGLSYLGQAADYLADGQIDQNAAYNKFSHLNSAIRNEVSGIVENRWGKVGSFAYQTGMSMGDFLFNTAITGGNQALSLAIMGSGAAADATVAAKDRGLNDTQSFTLGTVAGLAEILTEKVSLEALLDKTGMDRNAVGYVLKNILAEGSEEVASDLINLTADVLVSRDQSEWAQAAASYQRQGMSKASAYGRAAADQAAQMGLDFLGGAISGGIMAGSGAALGAGLNAYDRGQQRSISKRTEDASNRAYDAMREYGMLSQQARDTTAASLEEMGRAQGYRPGTGTGPQKTFGEAVQEQIMGNQPQSAAETVPQVQAPQAPQAQKNAAPGVEISERAKKQLSGADQRTLQNLSQITGSNIQFVTREQMDQIAGPGAEGVQRNGQIYISEDAQRLYMEIAKHEITHRLQQTAPENYARFRDNVADLYRETGDLDAYLRGAMEDAARAGRTISEDEAMDELAADYSSRLLTDEKAVRKLAGEDRGLLTRMLDALRDFISKVKTALGGKGNAETAELEQSAAMWQAALEESAGNKGKTIETAERIGSFSDEIARQLAGGDQRLATREGAELLRQVDALRRQNQRLREQMKRTTGSEMDEKSVRQLSRSILKDYNSSYAVDDLSSRVSELYKKIAEQTISDTDARAEARAIAGDILDGSQTEINPLYEEYSELRKELRTRPIAVSKDLKSGMVEAWGDFRRQNLGRLKLGNDGTQVDVLYDELSDRFPEFFPEDIINPADQLARMAEVADELQSVMGNAYEGAEMDRMADFLAGDILERFLETPRRAPTFADRQAKKLEAERQRGLDALERQKAMFEGRSEREMEKLRRLREGQLWDQRKRFEKERARDRKAHQEAFERQKELLKKRDDKIAELKEKHRRQNKERSENRTASQRREQILRHVKRLSEKLLKPTDKAHIPEKLRTAAIVLLQTIDTESNYEYGPGGRLPIGAGDQPGAQTGLQGIVQTKRTLAARELQAQYAKLVEDAAKNGDIMTIDPDLAGYLDNIAEMGDTPLSDLNKDQLETIWKAVKAVEASVSNADKLLAQSRFRTVSGMASQLDRDSKERKARSRFVPGIAQIDGILNLDMLTPETYLHKLGAAGDDLFRQMRRAQDRQTEIQAGALERFQKVYKESKQNAWKLEKETNSFQTGDGKEIKLSTAEVMELYLLAGREQAMGHLLTGGIRPEAVKGRGIKLETTQGAVHLTGEDISSITGTLTPEQKKLADGMRDVMRYLAERGNEASMEVYGYEKFKEQNYWPIKTGDADTASDPAAKAASKTIPGYGMTKQTKPNAQTPVVLHSVFDTFAQHTAEMSTYAAWLGVNENATRLLNFKFYDGEGRANGTVKDLLGRVHGEGGTAYLEQLLGDIAQGTKAKRDTIFSSGGLTSAFKSSAIAGNFRVALQQPTAVLRAMEMISPKYFATSLNVKDGWEKAKQYAPIAQWKDWGYFEMDTGRSYKDLMLGEKNALGKLNSKLMTPAGFMDAVGWGYLWNVAEAETKANRQDLKPGSEDFYKAVAKRFGEVVDRTQVVDSVLHRTQLMRSGNAVHKMASSFMSEPSKQYNEIVRGVYDFTAAGDGRAKIRAAKHIVRTALAMSVSFALNAVAQSLLDTNRDDDRDKDLGEKFQEKWVENFIDNYKPWNYIPYFKDIGSLASGYDVGRMDMTVAADILKAADTLKKAWNGTGKRTTLSAALDAFNQFCRAAGLPAQTIEKDVRGLVGTIFQGLGMNKALYDMDKLRYNIAIPDNRRIFVGHLYRAMDDNREDYEAIYQDLLDSGMDEKDIENAMNRRLKEALELQSVAALPFRWAPPGEDRDLDKLMKEAAEKGKSWVELLPEGTVELALEQDSLGSDADKLEKIKKVSRSPFGADVVSAQLESFLSDSEIDQFRSAKKAGFSIQKWAELYEDAVQAREKRTGKSGGTPSQEDVRSVLEKSGLSEAKKKTWWASYQTGFGWKKEWDE